MPVMNENIQAWVDELKTTDKPQSRGVLHEVEDGQTVGYCCLGIWCEMALNLGVEMTVDSNPTTTTVSYDGATSILPTSAADALGADNSPWVVIPNPNFDHTKSRGKSPVVLDGGLEVWREDNPKYLVYEPLTDLNDLYKLTFAQIAQLVEFAGGLDNP